MPEPQVPGLNLSELVDYRIQCPWKNELRTARLWWEATESGGSETVVSSRLTSERDDGFPASIPAGRRARTVIGTGAFPVGGTWICSWDGQGEVGVSVGGQTTRSTGGQFSFTRHTSGDAAINITIYSTTLGDPVRNLWIGEDRYFATRNELRLKPEWRDHILAAAVSHVRFMDWQHTNGSSILRWGAGAGGTKRPHAAADTSEYYTDSGYIQGTPGNNDSNLGNGATYSSILNCAIELGLRGIYLCVPHQVDEGSASVNWVEQMIRFIAQYRHPYLNVGFSGDTWWEFSNETWNPSLGPAYNYCKARGVALDLDGANDHEKGHSFYAYRSREIFQTALAARTTWGLPGRVIRVLAGQAAIGEYAFRFRTQINARSLTPTNVESDYWAVASYCSHTEFDASGGTEPFQRVRQHEVNPWLTPAEYVATTDLDFEIQARRDLTQRVLAPVSQYSDGTFPSNPIIRGGGIAADVVFAGDRGMNVVCYEGGADHMILPSGGTNNINTTFWSAAAARNVAWHATPSAGVIAFEVLESHVTAGCHGTFIFDEGTLWSGYHGCWSWYRDHRSGYSIWPRYVAAVLHHRQGTSGLSAQVADDPTVVSRGASMVPVLETGGDQFATVVNATAGITAAAMQPGLSAALTAEVADATAAAGATECMAEVTIPLAAVVADSTAVTDADPINAPLLQIPPPLFAALGQSEMQVAAEPIDEPDHGAEGQARVLAGMTTFVCAESIRPLLLTHNAIATIGDWDAVTRASAMASNRLAGADGIMTRNKFWRIESRGAELAGFTAHGTTIYRGQLLGHREGRIVPWQLGDEFAGMATEHEPGVVYTPNGVEIRAYDYAIPYIARALLWWPLDADAVIGSQIYVKDDTDFTLTPNGDPIGKLTSIHRSGALGLIAFEGESVEEFD